jgi:hypothetical protein
VDNSDIGARDTLWPRRGGAARNKFRACYVGDGGENKTAAGLGLKTLLVLRRRGGGWEGKKNAAGLGIKKLLVLRRRQGSDAVAPAK